MCIADGKARTVQKQKAAQGKTPSPTKRSMMRNRTLAAMLSDDEDSDADAIVTVKVMNQSDRWAQLNDQCLAFVFLREVRKRFSATVPRLPCYLTTRTRIQMTLSL